jgi:hypothetical protein
MYHGVTQTAEEATRKGPSDDDRDPAQDTGDGATAPSDGDSPEGGSSKKERVLHTRVPAVLERELKRFATNLRVPVSNLVRTILEDAVSVADAATENVEQRLKKAASHLEQERKSLKKRIKSDPLADVFAFQSVKLAQEAECSKCERAMKRGQSANLGLTDPPRPPSERVFVCDACVPSD